MPKATYTLDLTRLNWDDAQKVEEISRQNGKREELLPYLLKAVNEPDTELFKMNMNAQTWANLNRLFWRLFWGYDDAKN